MLRTLTATLAAGLLAFPAGALALHGPTGSQTAGLPAVPASVPDNPLRDGKYLPQPVPTAQAPVQVVKVIKSAGFDVGDALIGAAVGALVLAVIGGAVLVAVRDRPDPQAATGTSQWPRGIAP